MCGTRGARASDQRVGERGVIQKAKPKTREKATLPNYRAEKSRMF
jgi:hypothetical protein